MSGKARKVFRWLGWITGILLVLLVLIFVGFYLGRNWMKDRALAVLNEDRPGELVMGNMNLTPFMHFPSMAIQLKDIRYYQDKQASEEGKDPFLILDHLYVSLNPVELLRGNLVVNHLRLEDGLVHYEIFRDSLSNLEKALGQRLAEEGVEGEGTSMQMGIDLRKIEVYRVRLSYRDSSSGRMADLEISDLESRFRSREEQIDAGVRLEMDIRSIRYDSIQLKDRQDFKVRGNIRLDKGKKRVLIEPSSVEFQGLDLQASGLYEYGDSSQVDVSFTARNTGLEVLNFMLLGILDLEDIEQVGRGKIALDGSIRGPLGEKLPEMELRGSARDMAFRLKAYDRVVEDISFDLEAKSGTLSGFRGAEVVMSDFRAQAPDAWLQGDVRIRNLKRPVFSLDIRAAMELGALEHIIRNENMGGMRGNLALDSRLEGRLDPGSDRLFNGEGRIDLDLQDVGFDLGGDSLRNLNGRLRMDRNLLEADSLEVEYNGNRGVLGFRTENLLHYILGYERDVKAALSLESELLMPGRILEDSSLVAILGDEVRGLGFGIEAGISHGELDAFLKNDSIPHMDLSIRNFAVDLLHYADISQVEARIGLGPDSIVLSDFRGSIGDSHLELHALVENYRAILEGEGDSVASLEYALSSELVQARDLFLFKDEFILPETYREEYLEDFRFAGRISIPVAGLVYDSVDMDFQMYLEDAAWNFRNYPLVFDGFRGKLGKKGMGLYLDDFEGSIGESDFRLSGMLENVLDTTREKLRGSMDLESALLDFNQLLNFQAREQTDTTEQAEAPALHQIDYPDFTFRADVNELRYGDYHLFGIEGQLRSSEARIFYLDSLFTSTEGGGSILLDGQINVSNPYFYNFSAHLDLKDVDIDDLEFELQSGEESQSLSETFAGQLSAKGLAEIFITPELKLDMAMTTAMFQVNLREGRLMNFTPLEAVGKFLDNKDLSDVRFSNLTNTFTLVDSEILIPRMRIESTIGNMILEGEQGLDGSYLYLLRLPTWLIKEAARNRLTSSNEEEDAPGEDEIKELKMGKFMRLTVWGEEEDSKIKLGDKREKFR